MGETRSKAVWPWIATLLIGFPVAYTASFGPAVFLMWKFGCPDFLRGYVQAADPVDWIIAAVPEPQSEQLHDWYYYRYLKWWANLPNDP